MGQNTRIEWTTLTFNTWWGCHGSAPSSDDGGEGGGGPKSGRGRPGYDGSRCNDQKHHGGAEQTRHSNGTFDED
jgi:hypothetical protein